MEFDNKKALQEEDAYLNEPIRPDPDEKINQLMIENIGLKKRLQELEKLQQVKDNKIFELEQCLKLAGEKNIALKDEVESIKESKKVIETFLSLDSAQMALNIKKEIKDEAAKEFIEAYKRDLLPSIVKDYRDYTDGEIKKLDQRMANQKLSGHESDK